MQKGFIRYESKDQDHVDLFKSDVRWIRHSMNATANNELLQTDFLLAREYVSTNINHLATLDYQRYFAAFPCHWPGNSIVNTFASEITGKYPNLMTDSLEIDDLIVVCLLLLRLVDIQSEHFVDLQTDLPTILDYVVGNSVAVSAKYIAMLLYVVRLDTIRRKQYDFRAFLASQFAFSDNETIVAMEMRLEKNNALAQRYIRDKLCTICAALFYFALPPYVLLEISCFIPHAYRMVLFDRLQVIYAVNDGLKVISK